MELVDYSVVHWGKVLVCGVFAWVVASLSACGVAGSSIAGSEHGHITISADKEGMRAYSDMLQGMITNGKSSPDTDTPYYEMRKEQTRIKAVKFSTKGRVK